MVKRNIDLDTICEDIYDKAKWWWWYNALSTICGNTGDRMGITFCEMGQRHITHVTNVALDDSMA